MMHSGGVLVAQSCPTLATPWTVAHQAPLFMEFSRQEYWSGLPFISQAIRCRAPWHRQTKSHLGETFYKSSMQNSHKKAQAKDELKKIRKHIDYNCD